MRMKGYMETGEEIMRAAPSEEAHLQYPDVRLSNGYCNTDLLKALILLAISGIKKVRE